MRSFLPLTLAIIFVLAIIHAPSVESRAVADPEADALADADADALADAFAKADADALADALAKAEADPEAFWGTLVGVLLPMIPTLMQWVQEKLG